MIAGFDVSLEFVAGPPDVAQFVRRKELELVVPVRGARLRGVAVAHQGAGANAMLYVELANTFRDNRFQFEHGDLVQVAETNAESMGDMTAAGPTWYKRHRVYVRAL